MGITSHIGVVGSRDFQDYATFCSVLEQILERWRHGHKIGEILVLVSGDATGADRLAAQYAAENGLELEAFPAQWHRYGKAAGPRRNRQIVKACDRIVAFWDGSSRGTASTIEIAAKLHKPVVIYNFALGTLERRSNKVKGEA
jgi:hypothetical protein